MKSNPQCCDGSQSDMSEFVNGGTNGATGRRKTYLLLECSWGVMCAYLTTHEITNKWGRDV